MGRCHCLWGMDVFCTRVWYLGLHGQQLPRCQSLAHRRPALHTLGLRPCMASVSDGTCWPQLLLQEDTSVIPASQLLFLYACPGPSQPLFQSPLHSTVFLTGWWWKLQEE